MIKAYHRERGVKKFSAALLLCISASIVLLAFYLRFHLLGAQSLWNDEGNSYVQATRSFVDIAANAARDIHPPGYYWLLAVWRFFTGDSEFALRSLSAFASVLSVAFTYALGRRLFGTLAGVVAALFVTLNTFSIYYAQEARMYSLLALWGVSSMWALVGFLQATSIRTRYIVSLPIRWAVALLNAAGLWTQYAYPFVMLAQGVMMVLWVAVNLAAYWRTRYIVSLKRPIVYYIAANLLTIVLYLPWLPTAWAQISTWPNTGDAATGEALGLIAGWLALGMTYAQTNAGAMALIAMLLLAAFIPYRHKRQWWRALFPVVWTVLSVGLFLALGLFREGNVKFLLPAQIGFAVWAGWGVDALWGVSKDFRPGYSPRVIAGIGAFILLGTAWSGLYLLYHDPDFQRDDYRGIVRDISADLRSGDTIILDAPNQEEVFRYYYRGDAPLVPLPPGLGGNDAETLGIVMDVIAASDRVFAVFWGEAERDPNRVVEGTLDTQAFEMGDQWYGDVRLARYVTPAEMPIEREAGARFGDAITLERYALSADTFQPGDVLQVRLDWQTDTMLTIRYKVFLQLLDADGVLAAQRDSEPGGGLALTTTWTPGETISDNHALLITSDLPAGEYRLIVGLYNSDNAQERLPVDAGDYLTLATITIAG